MSFEVDHILAINNGGTDTLDNKQASHRVCNRAKWDRAPGTPTPPREFVTWRSW
jgi:5-methylcytosine-specific restriction endonuclease McrA